MNMEPFVTTFSAMLKWRTFHLEKTALKIRILIAIYRQIDQVQ